MRQLLTHIAHPAYAISVLLFFILAFALIVYWVYFRVPKETHRAHARIPLENDLGDQSHE
jgi:cbb3-type cytochrome oxidase subunit 3